MAQWLASFVVRNYPTSGPVSTWMGDRLWAGIPSRYATSQLGQLSLASFRGRLIEYQLRLEYGRECHLCRVAGNTVILYGMSVLVAVRRVANCYTPLTFYLTYTMNV